MPSSSSAFAAVDQKIVLGPRSVRVAFVAVDEKTILGPRSSAAAFVAVDQNVVVPANPNKFYVWDATAGAYVRQPWYLYDPATGTWKQVF